MKKGDPQLEICRSIFNSYMKMIQNDPVSLARKTSPLNLIRYTPQKILTVCNLALPIIKSEPTLIHTTSPAIIVGDIHGQLLDLLRIFKENGLPNKTKYIFLGDYIDRGQFNLDVILFLLVLKVLFNHTINLILLRGNHEFHSSCSKGGFHTEITKTYGYSETIYSTFLTIFSFLPISAIVDNKYFLVHGGIGPKLTKLDQIEQIQKPIYDFSETGTNLLDCLLWSDPNAQLSMFHESTRNIGCMFGKTALQNFLKSNNLKMLIRGHESISQGFEYQFDNLCLTIFTASNYGGKLDNDGGIIKINGDNVEIKIYSPLPFLSRSNAVITVEKETHEEVAIPQDVSELMNILNITNNSRS